MVSIYDFINYREYLKTWIHNQKSRGYGIQSKIASAIGISTTMLSLILKGDKQLSLEQALELSDFIGHSENEADYFFLLVEFSRAGTFKLQQKLKKKVRHFQDQAKIISKRIKHDIELTDEIKSIYYSSWIYSGIRNLTAVPGFHDVLIISEKLNLPPHIIGVAVDFLLKNGLCKREKGNLTYGPAHTHVASNSPFVSRHHQNWRLRGFSFMDNHNESNLFYTRPMSLGIEAVEQIRKVLPKFIEEVAAIAGPSPSEKVYCWNMDWFEY